MYQNLYKILIIILLLFCLSIPIFAQGTQTSSSTFLKRMEDSAGVSFQMCAISPKSGDSKTYTAFAIPLQARYEHNRYMSFSLRLNQGFQSYDKTGLYGLGDMYVNCRYLFRENITFVGDITLPIGTDKLSFNEITAASAGRFPFINSQLVFGNSGFGLNAGASYGHQLNQETSIALGAIYYIRGGYTPIKGRSKYDPSDELLLAAGIEYGDKENIGFIGDIQLSFYSAEKTDGKKVSEPGTGFAFSGKTFYHDFRLSTLFYKRGKSDLSYGGEFKPPSILSFKLSYQEIWSVVPLSLPVSLMPYIGYEHTGEGTMVDAANQFLLGGYLMDFYFNGYPLSPFFEISLGSAGKDTSTFGLKFGTVVSFQVY